MNFSQMIKVLQIQNVLILCIDLLARRYASIVFIATDFILIDPLTRGLSEKLFANKLLEYIWPSLLVFKLSESFMFSY